MTPEQFCYWLQGFFEVGHADGSAIGPQQAKAIRAHLEKVFTKTTPDIPIPPIELRPLPHTPLPYTPISPFGQPHLPDWWRITVSC
jgi:hypothetical protein